MNPPSNPHPLVSIVCPAYQEEAVLPLFHKALSRCLSRLPEFQFEIIYVDDGSRDGTLTILRSLASRDSRVRYLSLSRNHGHQIALIAGMQASLGDAVITMDSDLQHPPELITQLLQSWKDGAQIVQTLREENLDAGWFKRLTSHWFYQVLDRFCEITVPAGAADFRLLDRVALEGLLGFQEPRPFIRGIIVRLGFRTDFVSYKAEKRAAGHSKYDLGKMIGLALDAFFSFSKAPLRIAFGIAAGTGVLAVVLLALGVQAALRGRDPTIIALWIILGFMAGCTTLIILSLGLIGEYAMRITDHVRKRPLYLVKERTPGVGQNASRDGRPWAA